MRLFMTRIVYFTGAVAVDLLGHFVFELSIREQHEAGSLFVTYKGFGASNCTMTRAEKVELECGDIVGDASVDRRPGWILPDAEVTVVTSGSSENHDIRAPFSSLLSGCGLVNVGIHGAYPLHKQHLGLLKNVMESFVLNGDCTRNSQPTPFVDDKQNILIRKVAFDEYQYLLCLTQPVEKGQTFALSFPSISSCLGSRHYQVAKFPQRSGIDDSLRTLSLEDLRAVLAWLIDEGLPLTEYLNFLKITGSAAPSTFKQACERRRRLHWVSRRVTSAIGDRASANDRIMSNALRFGLQTLSEQDEENHLDAGQKIDLSDTLIEQVSFEMKFATEFDYTCGGRKRLEWCSKALNLFERVTDGLSKSYVLQAGSELPLLPRVNDCITGFLRSDDFSNADVLDEFVFYRSFTPTTGSSQFVPKLSDAMTANNKIALAQTLETVACVGEPSPGGTLSVVMRQPSVVKDGIATLSMDWYRTQFWQIVSTAIMYFFLVLEPEEVRKFEVDKVLGSIRPLVVIESKVKEPKAISYVNALPLVVSMRQNVEVVPGSYDIFLGLVWPALQKYNWRLIAGSSATEVSFCSASVTRKRKGALYQQRNRKRASLTRELNLTGLSAVSKTTKRVIVALVTDEGDFAGSNDSDTSSNANLSVKAIFDLFRTWLIDKFAADEDFSKVFATAKIVQVIRCLQTCFDACAPWLTPIRGLAPAHLDGCRPIEVYRCEYLMQFLLSLPTALLNGEQSKLLNASDCFGIVHDLFVFIAEQYSEIFDKRAHPPREEYVYGSDATSSLCAKIRSLLADGTSPSEETQSDAVHNFLVTEEEGVTLTDFLVCVQQQGLPFRATKDDVFKKNGRVNLGAPGIVCRHCLGQNNEGRYFFSSSESLTASYTVLEKHCLRCKKTPLDIKEKLVETRSRHQEQRKRLPIGSQQAYFNILWAKFLENKPGFVIGTVGDGTISIIDGDNGEIVSRSADSSSWSETAQDELTFSNHVDLLDNIRNSVKLKQKEEIQEALDRYYSCLDYAGRIFHTDSMPRHFSAHWLTSKVSPKLHHGYSIEDIV